VAFEERARGDAGVHGHLSSVAGTGDLEQVPQEGGCHAGTRGVGVDEHHVDVALGVEVGESDQPPVALGHPGLDALAAVPPCLDVDGRPRLDLPRVVVARRRAAHRALEAAQGRGRVGGRVTSQGDLLLGHGSPVSKRDTRGPSATRRANVGGD